jgi:outer membrane protein insertion porin family
LFLLLLIPASEAGAQGVSPFPPADSAGAAAPVFVGRVSVAGNAAADSARILRTFELTTGSHYTEEAVRRGIRKLFALGVFSDVWVDYTPHGDTVDLVIRVKERPRIGSIEFTGNKKKEKADLEKKLFMRTGESYSPATTHTQIDSLLKFYKDEGYARATIDARADTVKDGREVTLTFMIHEGEKVKIERIDFVGAHAFQTAKLQKRVKSKPRGLLGGGEVKEEQFNEDKERLEYWYHSNGYRDMHVASIDLAPGSAANRLVLKVTVEEGPLYDFGKVTWDGNQVMSTPELEHMWGWKMGRYDISKIDKTRGAAFSEYAERGYLYVGIEPHETVRDGNKVDVAFEVTEGRPSNVRLVEIQGNRNTREKVIRRELYLHEGERVAASKLRRTRDNVSRLALFEDVSIDFAPADSSDVDVILKVKEKQVGTASAGAGFTNESGVTGFLELSHNNVNGSAQSLALHLERGGKKEDYSLSFTEPWFRDTPTLLGFSLYDTQVEQYPYREKRVGGSGRIGRPLRWPDYSRGSVSYALERVKVSPLAGVPLTDLKTYTGPTTNGIRSSVELNFLRLTTDNPFYPTRGTKLSTDDIFAGGPFGGSVNFHKHRYEGRLYFPSIAKHVTTMIRARVGLIGEYGDQNLPSPLYERFRLGGGTTTDPLRGYEEYQIVPKKFDYILHDSTAVTVSVPLPTPHDTTYYVQRFSHVRFPGGRTALTFTVEQQFPIVHPLHGVLFFDAGNTWDLWSEIKPFDLKMGAGAGLRMEIPLLGNIGFDYGYGFNRDDGPRAIGHFLIGNVLF